MTEQTAIRTAVMFAFPDGYSPSATYTFFQCGANMRGNRHVRARITATIRRDAVTLAHHQNLPAITWPVTITGVQHPGKGKRAFDVENVAPLVKAAIDGLRDAGVLVNDSPKWVRKVSYDVGERSTRGQLVLHIEPVEAVAA